MNSASWASFVSAGALGDSGPDDDDDRAEPTWEPRDDIGRLQDIGYRAVHHSDPDGSWWAVAGCGRVLGYGATAVEAWDDAVRRFIGEHPDF